MGQGRKPQPLHRLAGKRVLFQGKFDRGQEERLKAIAEAQQGEVVEDVDANLNYLVVPDLSAGKTIQKKVASLNGRGASIQVIDVDAFLKLAGPSDEEILGLIRAGRKAGALYGKIAES